MLESVSPYALLRASIPKPAAVATPYDLYSLAQSSAQAAPAAQTMPETPAAHPTAAGPAVPDARQAVPVSNPRIPARRTHYIADIQSRHTAAARRTTFMGPKA